VTCKVERLGWPPLLGAAIRVCGGSPVRSPLPALTPPPRSLASGSSRPCPVADLRTIPLLPRLRPACPIRSASSPAQAPDTPRIRHSSAASSPPQTSPSPAPDPASTSPSLLPSLRRSRSPPRAAPAAGISQPTPSAPVPQSPGPSVPNETRATLPAAGSASPAAPAPPPPSAPKLPCPRSLGCGRHSQRQYHPP